MVLRPCARIFRGKCALSVVPIHLNRRHAVTGALHIFDSGRDRILERIVTAVDFQLHALSSNPDRSIITLGLSQNIGRIRSSEFSLRDRVGKPTMILKANRYSVCWLLFMLESPSYHRINPWRSDREFRLPHHNPLSNTKNTYVWHQRLDRGRKNTLPPTNNRIAEPPVSAAIGAFCFAPASRSRDTLVPHAGPANATGVSRLRETQGAVAPSFRSNSTKCARCSSGSLAAMSWAEARRISASLTKPFSNAASI